MYQCNYLLPLQVSQMFKIISNHCTKRSSLVFVRCSLPSQMNYFSSKSDKFMQPYLLVFNHGLPLLLYCRDIPLYLTFGDSVDCAMQSAGCDTTEFFASGLENFINTIRQNCPRSDLSGETCSEDCKTLIEDEYKKPCYSGDRMYWAAEMFRLKERSLNLQVGQTQYQDQSAFNALATCNTMYFDPETTDSAQDSNSVVRTGSSGSEHLSICYIFVAITSLAGIFTI